MAVLIETAPPDLSRVAAGIRLVVFDVDGVIVTAIAYDSFWIEEPAGGQWNYDKQNREKLPVDVEPPADPRFTPDEITRQVMDDVAAMPGVGTGPRTWRPLCGPAMS